MMRALFFAVPALAAVNLLHLRAGPSLKAEIVGLLPPNGSEV